MHQQMSLLQQNLNQIAQICNQLSQNEQANASKLIQMQNAERTAAQQLQHCAQLCSQVSQQMQQVVGSTQFGNVSQQAFSPSTSDSLGNMQSTNWANRPVSTGQFSTAPNMGSIPPYKAY